MEKNELTSTNQLDIIEQEDDGMKAVDGFSEPMTDWDFTSEQP
jgi:hypothetical protein